MANYKAVASGNWSNLAIWQDNSSGSFVASTVLPGAADDVWANGFTVTIDQNINVQSLSSANRTSTGITFDGIFQIITSGITVQAQTIWVGQRDYSFSFTVNLSNGTANIICTNFNAVNGTFGSTGSGLRVIGTNAICNLTATNITAVAAFSSATTMMSIAASNTLNVVTTTYLTGGGANNIINQGTTNITGNCYGSNTNSNAHCVTNSGTATIVGGAFGNNSAVINGGTVIASGQIVNFNGLMALRATASLRLYSANQTAWTFQTDNLSVNQTLYTPGVATGHPAEANVRLGTVYGPTNNLTGTCAVPPANAVSVGVPVDNTVGTAQLDANALAAALNTSLQASLPAPISASLQASLPTPISASLSASLPTPIATALDASLSASLPTPISASLQASLPTPIATALDASLSASLPAAIAPLLWDEDVANITTPNSIGERLKNCATVATTGAQISSFNP